MLQKTEGAITNRQSRKTVNRGYTRRRKTRQKHNTILPYTHHAWLLFHQMLYTSHSINRLPENIIEAKLVPIVNIICY
jgi:hypothetical protein